MTCTGDREIVVVSGILPDNSGELACMHLPEHLKFLRQTCLKSDLSLRLIQSYNFYILILITAR